MSRDYRSELLIPHFLAHKMSMICFHVIIHHARPAGAHDCCFNPTHLVFSQEAPCVPEEIVVGHRPAMAAGRLGRQRKVMAVPAGREGQVAVRLVGRGACPAGGSHGSAARADVLAQ